MGIGTSLGQSYDDEFHYSQSQWDSKYDTNEKSQAISIKPVPFETPLSPKEEGQFQEWKGVHAPNDSGEDYDFRGAFKAGATPDPTTNHWVDTFKKPNHPTFSDQSQYAKDAPDKAGSWDGDEYHPAPYGLNPPERETPFPRPRLTEMVKGVYDTAKNASQFIQSNPWELDQTTGEMHTSGQAISRAADLAGMMTFGPAPVAGKLADGTLGSFAGVRAVDQLSRVDRKLKDKLYNAQDMEFNKVHPDTIWKQTGFFRGADGQWRFEIADHLSKLNDKHLNTILDNTPAPASTGPKGWDRVGGHKDMVSIKDTGTKLGDILDHPELYKAYPHLKDIAVKPMPVGNSSLGLATKDGIHLAPMAKEDMHSVLLHEIQHFIQNHEGFARGGSVSEFMHSTAAYYVKELPKLESEFVKDKGISFFDLGRYKSAVRSHMEKEYSDKNKVISDIVDEVKDKGLYDSVKNIITAEKYINQAKVEADELYRRFMGEVEANNVIVREKMTNMMRLIHSPISTEEKLVPRSKQIKAGQGRPVDKDLIPSENAPKPANDNKTVFQQENDLRDERMKLINKNEKGGWNEVDLARFNKLGKRIADLYGDTYEPVKF